MGAANGRIAWPWVVVLLAAGCALGVAMLPSSRPAVQRAAPTAAKPRETIPRRRAVDAPKEPTLVWLPSAPTRRWECIVIHHSANEIGGASRFDDYHRDRGFDELGYHFVIGNGSDTEMGLIETGPRWLAQKHGAHCKTPDEYYNQHGIGICIVGNLEKHAPDPKQWTALLQLVHELSRQFDIPPEKILSHGQITGQTLCPGKFLDMDKLRREVAAKTR